MNVLKRIWPATDIFDKLIENSGYDIEKRNESVNSQRNFERGDVLYVTAPFC